MQIQLWRGWWIFKQLRTYEGEGTVWHDIETGRRPGTYIEKRLSEIEWKLKYDARNKPNNGPTSTVSAPR